MPSEELEHILANYFGSDGAGDLSTVLTFRYASNMAHQINVGSHEGNVIEAAIRHLAKAAFEAGRKRGRIDVLETQTFGVGPYR